MVTNDYSHSSYRSMNAVSNQLSMADWQLFERLILSFDHWIVVAVVVGVIDNQQRKEFAIDLKWACRKR